MNTFEFCPKCKNLVDVKHFYKSKKAKTGLDTYCKSCRSQISSSYHRSKKGKAAKARADKKYAQTAKGKQSHRKAGRAYNRSEKGRAKNKEWFEKYKRTAKGVEVSKKSTGNYRQKEETSLKRKAHSTVANTVAAQKMAPANSLKCSICGNRAAHYHHHSYEQEYWLDVIPVCVNCHNQIHLKP